MKHKFKVGSKVKILWDKTNYIMTANSMDIGEVKSCTTTFDGMQLVELYCFHKRDKHYSLHFPANAVRPLVGVVEDGDTL